MSGNESTPCERCNLPTNVVLTVHGNWCTECAALFSDLYDTFVQGFKSGRYMSIAVSSPQQEG